MKTTFKFIIAAMAASAVLTSCQKEMAIDNTASSTDGVRVISASFSAHTKSTLNGKTPKFVGGEEIKVSNATASENCTISVNDGVATFSTKLSGTLTAVYPSTAAKMNGNVIDETGVLVSTEQAGTFASANIAMATSITTSATFTNKTAVIAITPGAGVNTKYVEVITAGPEIANSKSGAYTKLNKIHVNVNSATTYPVYVSILVPSGLKVKNLSFADGSNIKTAKDNTTAIAVNTINTVGNTGWDTPYVEINGLKWATMNVGAEKVANNLKYCAGDYYQWGYSDTIYDSIPWDSWTSGNQLEITEWKSGKTDGFCWTTYTGFTTNNAFTEWSPAPYDETTKNLLPAYDASTVNWKGSWHTPASDDFQNLFDACKGDNEYDKTTKPTGTPTKKGVYWCDNYDGVAGVLFYDGSGKLFFPAAGGGTGANNNEKKLVSLGLYATYWTSSRNSSSNYKANYIVFTSSTYSLTPSTGRYAGFTIRPVSD